MHIAGHAMPIRSLTFSPDSQLLITASDDNHIKIYDVYHSFDRCRYQLLIRDHEEIGNLQIIECNIILIYSLKFSY